MSEDVSRIPTRTSSANTHETIAVSHYGEKEPELPTRIGRYAILGVIGSGGMGVVYEAQQENPRRSVALKVIRPELVGPTVMRRFDLETSLLGRLQHPGIAQIYEAGTADSGRGLQPFFAMEFVRGKSLTDYAHAHHLTSRGKLELIAKVCEAVQHAHQQGIIHRDIKPANILVDEQGQPKILDFGIARATESDIVATQQTDMGQLMGTLPYMSPEQVGADPTEMDTRSDVYALGVSMYELLCGKLPFDLPRKKITEAARIIREDDPSPLSSFDRALRGDVETIVSKAMAKEKARRYESASELAGDIRRYLRDEPITARPPSAGYQLRKFARRNRALVGGLVGVAITLVAGAAVSAALAVRATRAERVAAFERDRARIEAAKAEKTTEFLKSIFGGIDPYTSQGLDTTLLRKLLGGMDERITRELADQPEVEAAIRATLGRAYTSLGQYGEADVQIASALKLQKSALGEDDRQTLKTTSIRIDLLGRWGKHAEAEELARTTLAALHRVFGENDADSLSMLGKLGAIQMRVGKYREAELNLRSALERLTRMLGADDARTLRTTLTLAETLNYQSNFIAAERLARQVVERRKKTFGPDHAETYEAMATLATAEKGLDKYAEAELLEREALAGLSRIHGPDNPQTLNVQNNLAFTLQKTGRDAEAEALYRQTLEQRKKVLGDDQVETLYSIANLGAFLYLNNRPSEAEPLIRHALEGRRRVLGSEHRDTLDSMYRLAALLKDRGNYAEAAELLGQIAALDRKTRNAGDPGLGMALYNWAATLQDGGDHSAAKPIFREVLDMCEKHGVGDKPYIAAALNGLAKCLNAEDDFSAAEEYFQKGLAMRRRLYPKPDQQLTFSLNDYGDALMNQKKFAAAEPLLRENLAIMREVQPDNSWEIGNAMSMFGACLTGLSRFTEAEPLLLEGYDRLRGNRDSRPSSVTAARARIVQLYQAWDSAEPGAGKADSLARWTDEDAK